MRLAERERFRPHLLLVVPPPIYYRNPTLKSSHPAASAAPSTPYTKQKALLKQTRAAVSA